MLAGRRARSHPRSSDCNFHSLSITKTMATSDPVACPTPAEIKLLSVAYPLLGQMQPDHCLEGLSERPALWRGRMVL